MLLLATTLWGAASAVIATTGSSPAPTLVLGPASIILLAAAVSAGQNPIRVFRESPKFFLTISVIEMVNIVAFYEALRLGETPVIVALHLTTPVILLVEDVMKRRRQLSLVLVLELVLIVGALILIGLGTKSAAGNDMLLGAALSVFSALCLAVLIRMVAKRASENPALSAAGIQLGLSAIWTAPMLLLSFPATKDALLFVMCGALFFAPALALYWRAIRVVPPVLVGIIGLNEAVSASVIVVLLGRSLTPLMLVAGGLILAAVVLEVTNRPPPGTMTDVDLTAIGDNHGETSEQAEPIGQGVREELKGRTSPQPGV